jgi:hypothetical protein
MPGQRQSLILNGPISENIPFRKFGVALCVSLLMCYIRKSQILFFNKWYLLKLYYAIDRLDNVGSLTSHNPIGLHGLLRG